MKRFVIRHGHTGVKRGDRSKYGSEGPPLDALGRKQATALRTALLKLNVDPGVEAVAVSEFLRTKTTAELAGFTDIQVRPVLNEIFTGLPVMDLKAFIDKRELPAVVLAKAQAILDNPPKERVWVTHGLVIMGLKELLGIKDDPFDPIHCEVLEIDFV